MSLTDRVPVPAGINTGLTFLRQRTCLELLGVPCRRGTSCQSINNPNLTASMETRRVGPIRVTGHFAALDSLAEIMNDIQAREPEVHAAIGTAGMLCCRLVRGSRSSFSNHSWGMAVDLKIDGQLDRVNDDLVQLGLAKIAPIFNEHKWFWGAGFSREDAMHFEVSEQLLRAWAADGTIMRPGPGPLSDCVLSSGDRGREVKELQEKLNALGMDLEADGIFGPMTEAAVMGFQAEATDAEGQPLEVDGIVGRVTAAALGLELNC
jgi:hypothetical protein